MNRPRLPNTPPTYALIAAPTHPPTHNHTPTPTPPHLQIVDLGVSAQLERVFTRVQIGTPHYMAPEMWERRAYSYSAGAWVCGGAGREEERGWGGGARGGVGITVVVVVWCMWPGGNGMVVVVVWVGLGVGGRGPAGVQRPARP